MRKVFCDSCGKEAVVFRVINFPCHIAEEGRHGYVDREWNEVSGRDVPYDLCSACANKVWKAAFEAVPLNKK